MTCVFSLISPRASSTHSFAPFFRTRKACGVLLLRAKFCGERKAPDGVSVFFSPSSLSSSRLLKKKIINSHLARKRLVQLEQVDVVHAEPGQAARLGDRHGGPDAHHRGVDAHGSKRAEDAEHGQAALERLGASHQQDSSSAVRDLRIGVVFQGSAFAQ